MVEQPAVKRRPPLVLSVVRDTEMSEEVDWSSWYLTDEDDEGQTPRQAIAIRVLHDVVRTRLDELGKTSSFVGTDAFIAWIEREPLVRVSPDVYVLPWQPQSLPPSFQLWRPEHLPPTLAIEIVSEDWRKDYDNAPQKYAMLGASELVVFDPDVVDRNVSLAQKRFALQVFRRSDDGLFQLVYSGAGPAWIETVQAFGVIATAERTPVLRLARDAAGHELVPTVAEQRDAERQRRLELEARLAEIEGRPRS